MKIGEETCLTFKILTVFDSLNKEANWQILILKESNNSNSKGIVPKFINCDWHIRKTIETGKYMNNLT